MIAIGHSLQIIIVIIIDIISVAGTGTEPKRTGSGTGNLKIFRTGTDTFILIYKVPERILN